MKHSIIPAQITTVEDRIAGNLSLQQILILLTALIVDFSIFATIPKSLSINYFKAISMVTTSSLLGLLAIRYNGKLILFWAITVTRYFIRPKIYIFNKNTDYLRNESHPKNANIVIDEKQKITKRSTKLNNSEIDTYKVRKLLDRSNIRYSLLIDKKAGLSVHIEEVKL